MAIHSLTAGLLFTLTLMACGDPPCPEGTVRDKSRCISIDAGPMDSGIDSTIADGAGVCETGREVPCACGGGKEGFQRCRDDGSGYDSCVCGAGDAGTTDSSIADSTTPGTSAPDASVMCDGETVFHRDSSECQTCKGCQFTEFGDETVCTEEKAACLAAMSCLNAGFCEFSCDRDGHCIEGCSVPLADCETFCAGESYCLAECGSSTPAGAALYRTWQDCIVCAGCANSCDSASTCT